MPRVIYFVFTILISLVLCGCSSSCHNFGGSVQNPYDNLLVKFQEGYALPQLGFQNGNDTDLKNDVIKFNPGQIVKSTRQKIVNLSGQKILKKRGSGKVQLWQYANGHWQMFVDGKHFVVWGITYNPTQVGLGPVSGDEVFLSRWLFSDKNQNGLIDAPYESWVDKNGNHKQDPDEISVGDFQLMKEMGINAIRWYAPDRRLKGYDSSLVNKPLLRDLFNRYGIRVIVGDLLGAYTVGSDASWQKGTDYTDEQQRRRMKESVRAKVLDLKDEPFVLMWLLGNENNLPADYFGLNATRTNASSQPQAFAGFLNEIAEMIHELDPDHPVAVGNAELPLLDSYQKYASALDIIGVNSYRGRNGFGALFDDVKKIFDRPVLITEYGADAFYEGRGIDEDQQERYHAGNLRDIVLNQAGGPLAGNSIGGVIFEYLDEWWKAPWDPEEKQCLESQGDFPMPDGESHEEWYGIVGQGSAKNSPFERHLRKTYHYYKSVWGAR